MIRKSIYWPILIKLRPFLRRALLCHYLKHIRGNDEKIIPFTTPRSIKADRSSANGQSKLIEVQSKLIEGQSKLIKVQSKLIEGQSKLIEGQSKLIKVQLKFIEGQSRLIED